MNTIDDIISSLQEAKNQLTYLDLEGNVAEEVTDLIDEAIEKLDNSSSAAPDDEDEED